jgi:hypothetical protein
MVARAVEHKTGAFYEEITIFDCCAGSGLYSGHSSHLLCRARRGGRTHIQYCQRHSRSESDSFPANYDFVAHMGKMGTLGLGGVDVGTTNSAAGGSFQVTFTIPDSLKGQAQIALRLDSTKGGFFAYNWFNNVAGTTTVVAGTGGTGGPLYTGIPTFEVVSLSADKKVTIQTANFPQNYDFDVRMGKFGTLGVGGTDVGTINSGAGGAFQATFDLPDALKNDARVAIRMDSTVGGFYAFNWFDNADQGGSASSGTGGTGGTGGPVYSGIPTFSVTAIDPDNKVTILTNNFPQNYDFLVTMGAYGTMGVGGILVDTTNSGAGGSFSATYAIPAYLKGSKLIAIRLTSKTGGFFAYNWFANVATGSSTGVGGSGGTGGPVYTGVPTFTVSSVVKDGKVTIQTTNFPQNYDFKILMGAFGTAGIGGTQVATINSGAGGSFTETFTIPASLQGSARIAIRMESTVGGFFAYNWLWNVTTP